MASAPRHPAAGGALDRLIAAEGGAVGLAPGGQDGVFEPSGDLGQRALQALSPVGVSRSESQLPPAIPLGFLPHPNRLGFTEVVRIDFLDFVRGDRRNTNSEVNHQVG
jgi:hypothetical protein